MDFKGNSFAILDVVGDDESELPVLAASSKKSSELPVLAASSKKSPSSPPQSKKELSSQPLLPLPRFGRGRGTRLGQRNELQKIQDGQHNQDDSNGNQRYDQQVYQRRNSGYGPSRYNGQNEGYPRINGRANGYQQQSRGDNGYRKNSNPEQNTAYRMKSYRRYSPSTKIDGSEQAENHMIGGGRRRNFNEDTQLERRRNFIEDSQHERKSLERGSEDSQNKLHGDKLYGGEANQARYQKFNSGWERRRNREGNNGNSNGCRRSFVRHRDGGVKASNGEETLGDNEVAVANIGESPNMDGKESVEALTEAEPKGSQEVPAMTIDSKEQMKEAEEELKEMTLREYEKQLVEKRKALEGLKTEERKVTVDKDFESMQLVGRKKEEFSLQNLNSDKEKVKKTDSFEKEEKLRKSMSIEEFQKRYGTRGNIRGGRRFGEGRWSSYAREDKALDIKDSSQFPGLCGSAMGA